MISSISLKIRIINCLRVCHKCIWKSSSRRIRLLPLAVLGMVDFKRLISYSNNLVQNWCFHTLLKQMGLWKTNVPSEKYSILASTTWPIQSWKYFAIVLCIQRHDCGFSNADDDENLKMKIMKTQELQIWQAQHTNKKQQSMKQIKNSTLFVQHYYYPGTQILVKSLVLSLPSNTPIWWPGWKSGISAWASVGFNWAHNVHLASCRNHNRELVVKLFDVLLFPPISWWWQSWRLAYLNFSQSTLSVVR